MKVKEEPWRSQGRLPANPALQSSNPSLLMAPARNKEKVLKGKDGSSPVEHGDAQNPGTENKVCWGDEGKCEHFNNYTFGKCMASNVILLDLIKMQNFALLVFWSDVVSTQCSGLLNYSYAIS